LALASLVFVPKTTRWSIQSMYTAAQMTPVPASIVTIHACLHGARRPGAQHDQKLAHKTIQERQTDEESEAMMKSVENHGMGRAKPPKSLIILVCRRS